MENKGITALCQTTCESGGARCETRWAALLGSSWKRDVGMSGINGIEKYRLVMGDAEYVRV